MKTTYRLVWITPRARGVYCPGPFTHAEACTVLSKVPNDGAFVGRRVEIEAIAHDPG